MPETTVEELKATSRREGADSSCSTCASRTSSRSAGLPGSTLIPLGQLPSRLERAAAAGQEIIVHCKTGVRSAKAVAILKENGIEAKNLKGGIVGVDR